MWQMLTRESPYHEEHEDPHVIIYQIVTRKLRPKFPNNSLLNVPKLNSSPISYIARSISPRSLSNSTTSLVSSLSSISLSSASSNEQINVKKSHYSESSSLSSEIRSLLSTKVKTVPSLFKTSSTNIDLNQTFEQIYRHLIEKLWSDDHTKRPDAKQLKETLLNTKITYN